MRYAEGTSVDSGRTRGELERLLAKYGASGFMYGSTDDRAIVVFEMRDRRLKFIVRFPTLDQCSRTPKGRSRTQEQAQEFRSQRIRELWRSLLLSIKAKLESVESEIETFEEAFLAHVVTPGGETIGERLVPQLDQLSATRFPLLIEARK